MQWDDELNDEQKAACAVPLAHRCLLAGPGTGKTRVLTHRVAYLHQVHGVALDRILVLTFTRAAAAELKGRLIKEFGEPFGMVRVATIHAFALRQLVRNDAAPNAPDRVVIADDADEAEVIYPDLRKRLEWRTVTDVRNGINQIAAGWAQATAEDPHWEESHALAPLLGALREHRTVYGYALRAEIVYKLYLALKTRPEFDLEHFDFLLVDEYQDLTETELRVVGQMAARGAILYGAGDDDQAIYGWRKATPDGIRRFEQDFGPDSFVPLVLCQRCDAAIVDLAQKVIAQDPNRLGKELHAVNAGGTSECHGYKGHKTEAAGVATIVRGRIEGGVHPENVLVLVRGKNEIGRITEALTEAAVPLATESDPYADLRERDGRKVLLFLRLVADDDENLAWREYMRVSGFSEDVVFAYHEQARALGRKFADVLGEVHRDPEASVLPRAEAVSAFVAETIENIDRFREAAPTDLNAQLELLVGIALGGSSAALVALLAEAARSVAAEGGQPPTWRDAALALAGRRGGIDDVQQSGGVRIMTMHGAKGLGADTVVIAGCDHAVMHKGATGAEWHEEVRLMYVSLTRAVHYLAITFPGRRTGNQAYRDGGGGPQHLSEALADFVETTLH